MGFWAFTFLRSVALVGRRLVFCDLCSGTRGVGITLGSFHCPGRLPFLITECMSTSYGISSMISTLGFSLLFLSGWHVF